MPLTSFEAVEAGLRKGTYLILALLLGASLAYFAVYYWYSTVDPAFPLVYALAYLAVAITLAVGSFTYQKRVYGPRILGFVRSLSAQLRSALYIPYGMRMRGLVLTFDSGLVMFQEQNVLSFRLFLGADGSILKPTVLELRSLLRSLRGAKRLGSVTSRKGDPQMQARMERIRTSLGAPRGFITLFEQTTAATSGVLAPRWTSVAVFFVRGWTRHPETIGSVVGELAALLEQSRTGLAIR